MTEESAKDQIQDHRLEDLEKVNERQDDLINRLLESQIRADEQFKALAEQQTKTQELLNGVGKKIVQWMMGIGSAMVAAILGGSTMM
jgi:predicted PurR-regulated permease PerM